MRRASSVRALEVVAGAGGDAAERDLLGDAAAEQDGELIVQVVARVVVLLVGRQLLREPERHAARDDRDLVNRVRVRQQHREDRVARLVDGGDLLLGVADDHRAPLGAHEHLVLGELEVDHPDDLHAVARRVQRRFVHEIREIGAREARGSPRQRAHVHIVRQRDLARVHREDALAALHVGTVHDDAAVEAARAAAAPGRGRRAGSSPRRG